MKRRIGIAANAGKPGNRETIQDVLRERLVPLLDALEAIWPHVWDNEFLRKIASIPITRGRWLLCGRSVTNG